MDHKSRGPRFEIVNYSALIEFEQRGRDRARYGAGLLTRLSGDLRRRGIAGASPDVLERVRLFYTMYPAFRERISATVSRRLPLKLPVFRLPVGVSLAF